MTDSYLIDADRTICLCAAGQPDYIAATAVAADGGEHLVLALEAAVGDERVRYDARCRAVAHEQLGELPIEYVRRVTIAATRRHRCGRPTAAGGRCRIEVDRPGGACHWHKRERAL
jgi:hypothetical protein